MNFRFNPRNALIFAIFVLDRLSKNWASSWLKLRGSVAVLPFFNFTYVENTGAAFGIGFSRNGFLIGLTGGLLLVLFYLARAWKDAGVWVRGGLMLVTAGALGNLYDRIFFGYVVDFLDLRVWPVFNVADSCVTLGACCLAFGFYKDDGARVEQAET